MTLSGPTLGSLLDGRPNSLTTVRLLAAVAVVVSHSFPIVLGVGTKEPLALATPFTLGQHAVNAFFVISGFTLSNSLERRPLLGPFIAARILRIFPGLCALGVVVAFGLGPYVTSATPGAYLSDARTYLYPLKILVLFNEAPPPPGLFEQVHYAGNVNEPLWTIRYELAAYCGLAMMAALGIFRSATGLAAASFAVVAFYCVVAAFPELTGGIKGFYNMGRLATCFMIGVVAHRLRDRVRLSAPIALAMVAGAFLLRSTPLASAAFLALVAYLVFCAGALPLGPAGRWLDRNDLSYGTYLYGWPIQQTLVTISPTITVAALIATAVPAAVLAGALSWTFVERPALRLKRSLPPGGATRPERLGPAERHVRRRPRP